MSFAAFQKLTANKFKFGLFLFTKLPSAFICGVRLRSINPAECVTSVPYKWLSQNPFKSTYFACQAMAAEMSTGMLGLGHIYQSSPPVSMLVVKLEAAYFKKATERIYFTCSSGEAIKAAIEKSKTTGEGQAVECLSIGKNKAGDLISEFKVTWSFKVKTN
ncbi:MAG: thioesterase [Bacteroidota bacterium]